MSKKIWDMYLEQEANASRLQAEVERLTAEIDNIKQVEFPRRVEKVAEVWRGECARLEEEHNRLREEVLRWQEKAQAYKAGGNEMNIDRKYRIRAVNPCSGNTHDENDSILFLAKDRAVPEMLRAYRAESERLGANLAHLESIELLLARVQQYQRNVEAKVPDTDLPCEIRRCIDGEGINDAVPKPEGE